MGPVLRSRINKQEPQSKDAGKKPPKRLALADQTNSVKSKTPNAPKAANTIDKYFLSSSKPSPAAKRISVVKVSTPVVERVPVYKKVKSSPRGDLPPDEMIHVYDFEVDENEPKVKKKRKRQRPIKSKPKVVRHPKYKKTVPQPYTPKPTQVEILKASIPDVIDLDDSSRESFQVSKPVSSTPIRPFYEMGKSVANQYTPMERDTFEDVLDFKENETPARCVDAKKFGVLGGREVRVLLQPLGSSDLFIPGQPSMVSTTKQKSEPNLIDDDDDQGPFYGFETVSKPDCFTPIISINGGNSTGETKENNSPGMSKSPYRKESLVLRPKEMRTPLRAITSNYNSQIPIIFPDCSPGYGQTTMTTSYNSVADVPCSTPIKYNTLGSSSIHNDTTIKDLSGLNTTNFFGFDEPELFEEPLYSPIKDPVDTVKPPTAITPAKPWVRPETLPVKQIIKLLKFGGDEGVSTASTDNNKLYNEEELTVKAVHFFDDNPEMPQCFKGPPRRSYERPFKPRRFSESEAEDSGEEWKNEVVVKQQHHPAKKKNAPSKKDQKELDNWIKSFNSQCKQVDEFELCIE